MISKRSFLLALTLGLPALPALAQDDGLYPQAAAPDASFLRVIAPEAGTVSVNGQGLEPNPFGLTAYAEVAEGETTVSIDGEELTFDLGANTHYTVLASYEGQPLIEDEVTDSPSQADLLLYNLGDMETFELYATEAQTAALKDIAPGTHGAVGLKAPLTLTFELRADGETLGTLEPVELRRGAATTVVIDAEGAIYAADSTYE